VLVLGEISQRPEGVEAGTVTLVGANTEQSLEHARELLDDRSFYIKMVNVGNP
jgi:UDP-N-acetylglucosamine 2-epimerase (non-hydrolysing)